MSSAFDAIESGPNPGQLPPWLTQNLTDLSQRAGHAWLLEGEGGAGQFELAFALAAAWLCDRPTPHPTHAGKIACGQCTSCQLIAARTHPDLCVLLPETEAIRLNWPLSEAAEAELSKKERKPSKEVRVEDTSAMLAFSQRTASRQAGKVVLIYPVDRMNAFSANSILKVLEEPPAALRFVLACDGAARLLPTLRSRCQSMAIRNPKPEAAVAWLQTQGMESHSAQVWLKACAGRATEALAFAQVDVQTWQNLPRGLAKGQGDGLLMLSATDARTWISALQKLCHDRLAEAHGQQPLYFEAESLKTPTGRTPQSQRLLAWADSLNTHARQANHPLKADLLLEALCLQAKTAHAA